MRIDAADPGNCNFKGLTGCGTGSLPPRSYQTWRGVIHLSDGDAMQE
jgi:hypothetical protein